MITEKSFSEYARNGSKNGISIANSTPSWCKVEIYKDLQPGWKLVNAWKKREISNKEYEIIYRKEVLSKLDKEKVKKDLDGKVILCWCNGNFCHRFIVIKWLGE